MGMTQTFSQYHFWLYILKKASEKTSLFAIGGGVKPHFGSLLTATEFETLCQSRVKQCKKGVGGCVPPSMCNVRLQVDYDYYSYSDPALSPCSYSVSTKLIISPKKKNKIKCQKMEREIRNYLLGLHSINSMTSTLCFFSLVSKRQNWQRDERWLNNRASALCKMKQMKTWQPQWLMKCMIKFF